MKEALFLFKKKTIFEILEKWYLKIEIIPFSKNWKLHIIYSALSIQTKFNTKGS